MIQYQNMSYPWFDVAWRVKIHLFFLKFLFVPYFFFIFFFFSFILLMISFFICGLFLFIGVYRAFRVLFCSQRFVCAFLFFIFFFWFFFLKIWFYHLYVHMNCNIWICVLLFSHSLPPLSTVNNIWDMNFFSKSRSWIKN